MTRPHDLARLSAVLYAVTEELSDLGDQTALQRGAWLVDVAEQLANDITPLDAEQPDARASDDRRLRALLTNASRELSDLNDPRALQRAAWLVDVAQELVDDASGHAERAGGLA